MMHSMIKKLTTLFLLCSIMLSSCGVDADVTAVATAEPTEAPLEDFGPAIYTDASQPVEARIEDLLKRMTMDEKIGQMTQVEKNSIGKGDITQYHIGSILSGGGGAPTQNTVKAWYEMVQSYQDEALATRLRIPMIYGVDAVHGHGNMMNATIFPHNIGLGAGNNPELVHKIGRATAEEILASGIPWNFAPVIAVVQDVRWGRTYEGFGEETQLVSSLGTAYIKGMQNFEEGDIASQGQTLLTLATPKHFIGDGATIWLSSRTERYKLDQGNMQVPEDVLREFYLPPYQAALDAGAMNVMTSFSSWKGIKMHAQQPLMTRILKNEMGFNGFIVSDWQAIDQIYPDDYYASVVTSINAGVDMNMVPYDYVKFIETMQQAVINEDIPEERIDDAVRRILRVKFNLGLFEHPMPDASYQSSVRSREHLDLARQAVRESLVLLTNQNNMLPLSKDTSLIYVAGDGGNDLGLQSGGWTLQWQGQPGNENEGTTILSGIRAVVSSDTQIEFNREGDFSEFRNEDGSPQIADVGIVVIAEKPYAEGVGDKADISLTEAEVRLITQTKRQSTSVIVILLSGRPRVITDEIPLADAWVAAWLPGSEGAGVADVLFGDYPFSGKLSFSWPRSNQQLPININNAGDKTGCDAPLFSFGYGLTADDETPEILDCK